MTGDLTLMRPGSPCTRGHTGLRYRSSGRCVECTREDAKRHHARLQAQKVVARQRAAALGAGRG